MIFWLDMSTLQSWWGLNMFFFLILTMQVQVLILKLVPITNLQWYVLNF